MDRSFHATTVNSITFEWGLHCVCKIGRLKVSVWIFSFQWKTHLRTFFFGGGNFLPVPLKTNNARCKFFGVAKEKWWTPESRLNEIIKSFYVSKFVLCHRTDSHTLCELTILQSNHALDALRKSNLSMQPLCCCCCCCCFLTFISRCKSVSLWISTNYLHHLTAIYGQWNDLIWSACSECEAIDSMLEANARTRLFMLCVNAVPVISFDFVLNFPHVKFFHDSLQWNKFKLNWLAYRSLWMNQISIYRRSQLSKWFYK